MFHSKVANLFEPDHLQFKSCFSGCFTTFVYADSRYFISAYMEILAIRHGFHRIPIKIKLQLIGARVGRTELPVAMRIFPQFPMALQDKAGVSQSLY